MWARLKQKPFSLWVIAAGVFYLGLALLGLIVLLAIRMGFMFGGGILLFFLIFVAVFFIAGVFVLREKRWAYVTAAAVSLVFFFLNITEISSSIANPADAFFWLGFSSVPTLILVVAFSILDFRSAKTGLRQKRSLSSAQSTGGILTFTLIGFVVGGLVAGAIGAGVILRNISAGTADITIVPGAPSAAIPFTPQVFQIAVGDTVAWINKDTTSHTVTSNVSGQFDSGLLSTGASFNQTFTTAGSYYYHCTPHPQMWGEIVVS